MAKEIVTFISDDIDGTREAKSYKFSLGNDQYEIDLSDSNYEKLQNSLAVFIEHGAKVTARLPRPATSAPRGNKEYLAKVRSWALENGLPASSRGRIAQTTIDAYEAQAS